MKRYNIVLVLLIMFFWGERTLAQYVCTYTCSAFTFQYPSYSDKPENSQSTGRSTPSGDLGIKIDLPTSYGHGATNEVTVVSFILSKGQSYEKWIDSICQSRKQYQKSKPRSISVGSYKALEIDLSCEDCEAKEVILHHDDQIVLLAWMTDEYGEKRRKYDREIFNKILSSFKWKMIPKK